MRKYFRLAAAAFAAAVLTMGMSAMASDYTTQDGILTVTAPDETWKEIQDPNTWVTLGNGNDTITILHYKNGDELPPITVAGEHYAKVYQMALSTRNEVFIVTGSVVDATNFAAVRTAVESTKLNKYDVTVVPGKNTMDADTIEVADEDFICYVISSGLNVRESYSTDSAILGTLDYAEKVEVTGTVMQTGAEIGWYRIRYGGKEAFVSASFLSMNEPAQVVTPQEAAATGSAILLYSCNGGTVEVYEYSDGSWYDYAGNRYVAEGAGQWACSDGSYWSTNAPAYYGDDISGSTMNNDVMKLSNENGDVYVGREADGNWYDMNGTMYFASGAGRWEDENGIRYTAE